MSTQPLTLDELIAAPAPAAKPKVDETSVLFPQPNHFEANGETISVREFKFGELPSVIKLLRTVGPLFMTLSKNNQLNSPEAILNIIDTGGEDLIKLLALNVKKPRDWFDTVDNDVGISMLLKMLEVNINFFTNRVLPLLQTM